MQGFVGFRISFFLPIRAGKTGTGNLCHSCLKAVFPPVPGEVAGIGMVGGVCGDVDVFAGHGFEVVGGWAGLGEPVGGDEYVAGIGEGPEARVESPVGVGRGGVHRGPLADIGRVPSVMAQESVPMRSVEWTGLLAGGAG